MSEIFDFLRKPAVDSKKTPPSSPPELDLPIAEPMDLQPESEPNKVIQEPVWIESEIIASDASDASDESDASDASDAPNVSNVSDASDRFDLLNSTYQLRNVLDPLTVAGEQFRLLRSQLSLRQKQSGIKTVLVTSTVPQEGKSFTSCGLAGVFAQEQGKRVLVIDADMRKLGSGRDFGLNGNCSNVGMAQVLQKGIELRAALMKLTNPQFWFLPSGALPTNPSELLSSPILERVLKSAAESFDWVIVDSPPILALSDSTLLASVCDTVLLVVRANSTPAKLVTETINRIGQNRICGIVLNRQKKLPTALYYYNTYYRKSKNKE
jgi:capsular exopolysaccharide synthesis family protein